MYTKIVQLIQASLQELDIEKNSEIFLTHPREEKYGDWSTNIALQIGNEAGVTPMEAGKKLVKILNKKIVQTQIQKVTLVSPGFINFYMAPAYFLNGLAEILKDKEQYGASTIDRPQKIHLDFISANPTGPLTLGNARGGFFGDVLGNILAFAGNEIHKEYYINDTGKQIEVLGHSVLGNAQAVYKGDYIDALHKRNKLTEPLAVGEWAADVIMAEYIRQTIERMGVCFDTWFSERKLHQTGKVQEILEALRKKKLIYKKEGALWFKSSRLGDVKDRVFLKKDGTPTYFAVDAAYHKDKLFYRHFDQAIDIWGADHHGDVARLRAAAEALGFKSKLVIILVQFVRLIEKGKVVRMSKRRGVYITVDELLDEIPLDVARFFFLMYEPNTHMDFDLNLARDTSEKNPVYYIQYAHARICNILKKAQIKVSDHKMETLSSLQHPLEFDLMRELVQFPEIIQNIAQDYEVHQLPYYALGLAEKFHKFYKECRVIGEKQDLSRGRLALVKATQIVLKNVLSLMGISAPEKM